MSAAQLARFVRYLSLSFNLFILLLIHMPWCKRSPLINKGIEAGIQLAYLTRDDKEIEIFNYLLDYYVLISFYIREFLYVFCLHRP
jgi:hypothetical protein